MNMNDPNAVPPLMWPAVLNSLRGEIMCAQCGKQRAICVGLYENPDDPVQPACDNCCGHGNEDGWCRPLESVFDELIRAMLDVVHGQRQ